MLWYVDLSMYVPGEGHGHLLEVAGHLLQAGLPWQSLGLMLGGDRFGNSRCHLKMWTELVIMN